MGKPKVALVDENNRFVRWMTREALHAIRGPHRSVQVFLLDSRGRLVVQLRHRDKLTFPSTWDISCSGHVEEHDYPDPARPDEGLAAIYHAVAMRELAEELGVRATLSFLGAFAPEPGVHYEHFHLYRATSDGPYVPQADEVEEIRALETGELDALLAREPVTPGLRWLVAWARDRGVLRPARLHFAGARAPLQSTSQSSVRSHSQSRLRVSELPPAASSRGAAPQGSGILAEPMSGDEDERTDPNIALPGSRPPSAAPPSAARSTSLSALPPPPRAPAPARPPSLPPRPASVLPPRPSSPPLRPESIPPSRVPRPSDPPSRPPAAAGAAERQRLMQMQTQLDEARSTIARQRNELDELRAKLSAEDARLGELIERVETSERDRLADKQKLDERKDEIGEELRRQLARAELDLRERAGLIDKIDSRVRELEDGEGARLRMRVERALQTVRELEEKVLTVEHTQRFLRERMNKLEEAETARDEQLKRALSLLDEQHDILREQRDERDLDGLRARVEILETLVVRTGDEEARLRKEVVALRESIVPGMPSGGDDLTRIKGVGPKFARALSDLGYTRFEDVAAWTAEDVARVAGALGIKPQRIEKAGWVASAAALAGPPSEPVTDAEAEPAD